MKSRSKTSPFRGICASSVTPFKADGSLDLRRIKPHIDWLIEEGVHAISPLGSSGEFAGLESDDRQRVLETALEACNGRVPVLAGTHHVSTRLTVQLSKHAEHAGANGLLIVPPYYMAPTPVQVIEHFRRIADAVSIPIVLYHNVPFTCADLKTAHLVQMFELGAIAGVKMSNAEPDRICELLQATGGQLTVYAGIDSVAFEGLCHGAHGWISGIPSIVPRVARQLYEAIAEQGDLATARALWAKLAPLARLQFSAYHARGEGAHWFSVMKATLNLIGPPVGDPLPPVLPLPAAYRKPLIRILRQLGYPPKGH